MSMNHPIPTCWPAEVYDYERKTITDVAVGGIDLRKGSWIHCKWCNSTLKTTSFSLITWRSHQRRQTHRAREKEFLENNLQLPIDHESLILVRRDLQKNKQHQACYERDVNNVINAMTTLVTDQQSDLDSLQHQVQDLTRQIQGLKKEIEILRPIKRNSMTDMDLFEKRFRLT
ncbi:Hypothetical protein PHPALM_9131 [Phytophthora palmivora]|uniref:Uncharacterized protein n=1 Tax=Phytophthora palmivora TaxID=4796 RepID=A0A2P4Y827_9STRA|nr:Hypothetical protein PHPALM_9131 [Phytophthora palmivora]